MNSFLPTVFSGMVVDFSGSSAPAGWLLLDGSVVSQASYASIYAIVGSTYNIGGEGVGNFRLPDCRGRVVVGAGTGSGITTKTLGQSLGAETHQLTESEMPIHNHTQNSHNHTISWTWVDGRNQAGPEVTGVGTSTGSTTATNNSTGGDQSHNNLQPSIVFNKIIKI